MGYTFVGYRQVFLAFKAERGVQEGIGMDGALVDGDILCSYRRSQPPGNSYWEAGRSV